MRGHHADAAPATRIEGARRGRLLILAVSKLIISNKCDDPTLVSLETTSGPGKAHDVLANLPEAHRNRDVADVQKVGTDTGDNTRAC